MATESVANQYCLFLCSFNLVLLPFQRGHGGGLSRRAEMREIGDFSPWPIKIKKSEMLSSWHNEKEERAYEQQNLSSKGIKGPDHASLHFESTTTIAGEFPSP